jgi:hypothetical protein
MGDQSFEEEQKALKPMGGTIRRLESTLMMKTWKKVYFTLEDDKLCFYKHHRELEADDVIDLSKVTSVSNKTYNPKPKEDEKWQIELATADGKVYLCTDTEGEMNDLIKNLLRWIEYFVAEVSSTSKDSSLTRGFSISNSERQNAQNLKGYYAALKRGDSGVKPTAAAPTASRSEPLGDPKQQILEIDSPARGGMYRSASGRDLTATPMMPSGMMTPKREGSSMDLSSGGISQSERLELQREEITALTMRLKQSLEAEAAYRKEIEQMKHTLAEKDAEMKRQMEELNASFDAKKRSFNFIINSKDFEIEKLRQEKQRLTDSKIKELEEVIALRDRHISELKSTLNDKEIEILERKESEMALQAKFETSIATLTKESTKKLTELQETFAHLKDRYFFALAVSHPALANRHGLDLNALYDRCIREQVPLEQWHDWLVQFSNENQRNEGEEENVENF